MVALICDRSSIFWLVSYAASSLAEQNERAQQVATMRCLTVLLAASTASALQPRALKKPWRALGKAVAPALLGVSCLSSIAAPPANAADKRQIASITASGLVFKDKLIVDAFADPKVEGVTLYVSDFERPVVERVQKDFFSDPSQSGLACSRRAARCGARTSTTGRATSCRTRSSSDAPPRWASVWTRGTTRRRERTRGRTKDEAGGAAKLEPVGPHVRPHVCLPPTRADDRPLVDADRGQLPVLTHEPVQDPHVERGTTRPRPVAACRALPVVAGRGRRDRACRAARDRRAALLLHRGHDRAACGTPVSARGAARRGTTRRGATTCAGRSRRT